MPVTVEVRNGIVTLTGLLGSAEQHDLIRVAGGWPGTLTTLQTW